MLDSLALLQLFWAFFKNLRACKMMCIPLYSSCEFFNGSFNQSKKVTANRQQKSVHPRVYNRLDTKNSHRWNRNSSSRPDSTIILNGCIFVFLGSVYPTSIIVYPTLDFRVFQPWKAPGKSRPKASMRPRLPVAAYSPVAIYKPLESLDGRSSKSKGFPVVLSPNMIWTTSDI